MTHPAAITRLNIVRRAIATVLVLLSMAGGAVLGGYGTLIDRTLANSRDIDRQFRAYGEAVVDFERLHHRLPDNRELKRILPPAAHGRYNIELFTDAGLCDVSSDAYSRLQESAYVLWIWRGEWGECFAPPTGLTTVLTNGGDYTVLGSLLGDQVALGAIMLTCLMSAVWLWNPKNFRLPRARTRA